jgi:poly-gamma-glutamate capsule biosynthesis protein CapA/YwtB (metallophosphatase superfamily)
LLVSASVLAGCNGWQHETIPLVAATGTLTVSVAAAGAPVVAATVVVGDRSATTDAAGRARVDGVREGGALVLVSAPGHVPEAVPTTINLTGGAVELAVSLAVAGPSDHRLLFAGDLSLDGRIDDPNHDGITSDALLPQGPAAAAAVEGMLAGVRPLFDQADLVTITLATVLGDGRTPHPLKSDRELAPPAVAEALPRSGIDVVNLGTGHAYDYLDAGVGQTLAALDQAGVSRLGLGRTLEEARQPALATLGGLTVGQVSLSALVGRGTDPSRDLVPTFEARADKGGVVEATPEAVAAAVTALSGGPQHSGARAGVVVAHLAAGREWSEATPELAALASAAAGAGATLVLGDGSRVMGSIAFTGDTMVASSLGEVIFGGDRPEARRGIVLEARFAGDRLSSAWIRPIAQAHYRPYLASGTLAARIVRHVAALSAPGTVIVPLAERGLVARPGQVIPADERTDGRALAFSGASEAVQVVAPALDEFLVSVECAGSDGTALPVEVGRDLLWDGDFEDHLAGGGKGLGAGWSFVGPDVGVSDRDPHGGALALEVVRKSGNIAPATARSAGLLTLAAGHRHTLSGCWRLEGGPAPVAVGVGIYNDRGFRTPRAALVGTATGLPGGAWTCFQTSLDAAAFDQLARVEIALEPPQRGTARLHVDDLTLVRWEDRDPAVALPVPNEVEMARCRSDHQGSARLTFTTRRYRQP